MHERRNMQGGGGRGKMQEKRKKYYHGKENAWTIKGKCRKKRRKQEGGRQTKRRGIIDEGRQTATRNRRTINYVFRQ